MFGIAWHMVMIGYNRYYILRAKEMHWISFSEMIFLDSKLPYLLELWKEPDFPPGLSRTNEIPGVYSDRISTMKVYINSMQKQKSSQIVYFLLCHLFQRSPRAYQSHGYGTLILNEGKEELMKCGGQRRQLKFYQSDFKCSKSFDF